MCHQSRSSDVQGPLFEACNILPILLDFKLSVWTSILLSDFKAFDLHEKYFILSMLFQHTTNDEDETNIDTHQMNDIMRDRY